MPRLDQLLARNLGVSRKQVGRLLRSGAIEEVTGGRLSDGRRQISEAELPLKVRVSGRVISLREHVHLMLHKPVGFVSSRSDPRHPAAWDLLDGAPMHGLLKAIGRLDLDAAGLLLWTTDGALVHALTHPRREVPRTYQVALARPWSAPTIDDTGRLVVKLGDGFEPRITALAELGENERHPALVLPGETRALAEITVLDGVHHEVKRIFAALGSHVLQLLRVSHGDFALPADLEPGAWRELPSI